MTIDLLVQAIFSGDFEDVKDILKDSPSLIHESHPMFNDSTPLHVAVAEEEFQIAKYLISIGSACDALDGNSATPLHQLATCFVFDQQLFCDLVTHGASVNARDGGGRTALMIAVETPSICMLECLLSNNDKPKQGNFPHYILDVNAKDDQGNTALHIACTIRPNHQIIETLRNAGADFSLLNAEGKSADSLFEGVRGISFEMTTDGCEIETNPVPLPSSTLSPGQTVRLVFTFAEKDEDEELEEDEELDEDEIVQNVRVRVDRIEEGIERDGEQVYRGQLLDEMHSLFEFLVPGLYVWFTPSEVFAVGDGDV